MKVFVRFLRQLSLLVLVVISSAAIVSGSTDAYGKTASAGTSLASDPPAAPVFSHSAGTYEQAFDLEITAEEGAAIYYTTNGRNPSRFTETYQGPIPVSGSMLIRARAYDEEGRAGEITTRVYSQLDRNVKDFDSNLPLVIVHQFDDPMHPGGNIRSTVYFSVIDTKEDGRARLLTDDLHLHSRSESNYRGSSSLSFPKKQFGVRLIDDRGENRNESILGMPAENNWIMHAPWDDRTLIRNAVAYRLSEDMGRYAPRTRFVELFLHEGDGPVTRDHYHGVYMLVERIKWDNNRVNIAKLTPEDDSEPEITGGYIINYDRDVHFRSTHSKNTGFALVRPQHEDITPEQRSWISGYIGDLETALFGHNFRDSRDGYAAWMDPESFIDHHLITEALKEMDGYRLSTFMYKDRGGRLVMGPLWDYNLSIGNHDPREGWGGDSPTGWYYTNLWEGAYVNGWYTRLFQDPDFKKRYHERWWELRQGPFATDHVVNMINDYVEKLDEARKRNFERWPIIGEDVWKYSRPGLPTYEDEIRFIINFIEDRFEWIDSQIPAPDHLPQTQLRYFWYFGEELANNTPFEELEAGYALMDQARIRFHSALEGYPFDDEHPDWRKASLERRNRPTDINYRPVGNQGRPYDINTMRALQVCQPFTGGGGDNTLVFHMPTTGMEGVVIRFAAMDEGAADELLIDYAASVDGTGEPEWTGNELPSLRHSLSFEYQLYEIDFSEVEDVNDNPDFRMRIRFDGEDMSADEGNRVTFNNFSLEAGVASADTSGNGGETERSHSFRLEQNYPNPFNPETRITYSLERQSNVKLTVYNAMGQRVRVLVDDWQKGGEYTYIFDASDLASGVYIYELRTGNNRISRKMTFVK